MKTTKTLARICMIASMTLIGCNIPKVAQNEVKTAIPSEITNISKDTSNLATINWHVYFNDVYLVALIDTALKNNQELNILLQEIEMSKNEVMAKKGEYLPSLSLRVGGGAEKQARYTKLGAVEHHLEVEPGKENPEIMPDLMLGFFANWEVDIWHKLRNAKKAANLRYLASIEGRNFMITHLVTEIADAYYELLSYDQQLNMLRQNISIQREALEIVQLQKQATTVTELAVRKFEAEVLKTKSLEFKIQQHIIEAENRLNYLVGRFPQTIQRSNILSETAFISDKSFGTPKQLLENRPDIHQAELQLQAAGLDVKSAKARFYPSLGLSAGIGLQAFKPQLLFQNPQSLLFSLLGDISAPLINRNAIKADYLNANNRKVQSAYNYQKTVINAYTEVVNHVNSIENLKKEIDLKKQQVEKLNQSIQISNELFQGTRADYMEVLMTQRDALESKFELIEAQKELMLAHIHIYSSLGGGWK